MTVIVSNPLAGSMSHQHESWRVANNDAASAIVVVGPHRCRGSAGRIVGSWEREERSDVSVKTVSTSFSLSDRPVRVSKLLESPGASIDVTWREPATHR